MSYQILAQLIPKRQECVLDFVDQVVVSGKRGVFRVLQIRMHSAVADCNSLKFYPTLSEHRVLQQHAADKGNVLSRVTLPHDKEIAILELRVEMEELQQEPCELISDFVFIMRLSENVALGKSCSDWLIDKQQVGSFAPTIQVLVNFAVGESHWPVFCEDGELRGAARAAGEPDDDGVVGGVGLGSEEPVEDVVALLVDGEEAVLAGDGEDSGE